MIKIPGHTLLSSLLLCGFLLGGPAFAAQAACGGSDSNPGTCQQSKSTNGNYRQYVTIPTAKRTSDGVRSSSILQEKFTRVSSTQGRWEGYVASVGTTHLRLVFLKNGTILGTRYIGSVTRRPTAQPTRFKFVSSLPGTPGWSWKIIAGTL